MKKNIKIIIIILIILLVLAFITASIDSKLGVNFSNISIWKQVAHKVMYGIWGIVIWSVMNNYEFKKPLKRNLKPLIPKIRAHRNSLQDQEINVAIYTVTRNKNNAKELFKELDPSLTKLCFSKKILDKNKDYFIQLSTSFAALYIDDKKYFIYLASKKGVEEILLDDKYQLMDGVKIIVKTYL